MDNAAPQLDEPRGPIVAVVRAFLSGPMSILVILMAVVFGAMAIVGTPREEEPQIVVPQADVHVSFPGHSPAEVEQLVTRPLERLMAQIEGVEHVYSISRRGQAVVMVRFYVGEDRDGAMVKIRDKIQANPDLVPPGVTGWTVDPVAVDDVPIVTFALYSRSRSSHELRRIAEELRARLDSVNDISDSELLGGQPRQIRIEPDVAGMAARGVVLGDITRALQSANIVREAGAIVREGDSVEVLVGRLVTSVDDVRRTVISSVAGRLVRVEDVATVTDGPAEPENYVHIGFGPAAEDESLRTARLPCVTLAFSKERGTNAVAVARDLVAAMDQAKAGLVPDDVEVAVTRNYGETANEKVNDLLRSMLFAVLTVVGLMAITMGWREALVVGLAVPVSFALALFVNYICGFTINRVTLFALILSLGLVVDDPITNVDNIQRHIRMKLKNPLDATLAAVHEVIPPVIMSTLAIIVSFVPMFFITGMMGPYMSPMAINVPLTVTFSTVCALTFVPWLAYHLMKGYAKDDGAAPKDVTSPWVRKLYRRVLSPFLTRGRGLMLLGIVVLLMLGSGVLVVLRKVPLKMLPFDNKNELQLVLDMPEGTVLEQTDRVVQELEDVLRTVNEVTMFQSCVGVGAPIDFNGLVRRYRMRHGPHQADMRINLAPRRARKQQSHAIALRIRDALTAVAVRHGAVLSIVEVPPGPPVLATVTVEIRGRDDHDYAALIAGANVLKQRLAAEDSHHIAQIDDSSEAPHDRLVFAVDHDKAALHGISADDVAAAVGTAVGGRVAGVAHVAGERDPLLMRVRLALADRSSPVRLEQVHMRTSTGQSVALAELGRFVSEPSDQPIYHKNLERVVFVTAECVGRPPGEVIMDIRARIRREPLPEGIHCDWAGEGEWEVTVRVFRDLGIAFGIAMLGIYLLLVVQMRSFKMPVVVMMAIPLTAIGIAPGFYFLNIVAGGSVGGYPNPVFFTATGMIGMIALGGIVTRNSIVLIEFIQGGLAKGMDLREAILESGAVRFRPIMLTAATTMIGAWPITLDPIFSGLAWALIFGLVASTLFTLLVIPTVYMLVGPRESS